MIKPRKRLLDTEAVAAHYRVKVGTVRSWATRHGWTPYGSRRNRLWDLNQVQATFDELETKRAMSRGRDTHARSGSATCATTTCTSTGPHAGPPGSSCSTCSVTRSPPMVSTSDPPSNARKSFDATKGG